jgi:hypothetical protein
MALPLLVAAAAAGFGAWKVWRHGEPRKVFFSFHYADIWRVNQVKNSWVTHPSLRVAGFFDKSLREAAKSHGESEIRRLIDRRLAETEVTAVLIGSGTFGRKWVRYEIEQSALRGNGLLGIYIHNLKEPKRKGRRRRRSRQGRNPFSRIIFDSESDATLDDYVPTYDWYIHDGYENLREWVREAPTLKQIRREHGL